MERETDLAAFTDYFPEGDMVSLGVRLSSPGFTGEFTSGKVIFKACEFEIGPCLVAPAFRAAVESAGLRGVAFRDLN